MSGQSIRELLNAARWRDGELHALEISVLHRGAPGDQRTIPGSRITSVSGAGVELTPDVEDGESIFVPYHRFLSVQGPRGVIWSKASKSTAAPDPERAAPTAHTATAVEEGTEVRSTISVVLRAASAKEPLVIDGSAGEGGGQVLRSSLTLSMLTGTPFVLENVRAGRKKPGLMRQHLTCVKAAAAICGAELEGDSLKSTRLVFRPGALVGGDHVFDVGSAGSVALVLQTIALPLALAKSPSRVVVRGGTHALWAPPYPFLESAWLPLVRRAGAEISLELVSHGFHPAGGGEVVMTTRPSPALAPLHLGTCAPTSLAMRAIVANLPESIARRELAAAAERLQDLKVTLSSGTVRSPGPGNAMWLVARDEGSELVNVFSAIGDVHQSARGARADGSARREHGRERAPREPFNPGVRSEDIGRSVAESFLAWRASHASIEGHLADQVLVPMAIAGEGSFTCDQLTLHTETNIEVIAAFTGKRFRAWDLGGRFRVAL